MKNFILAVIIGLTLAAALGCGLDEWFNISFQFSDHMLAPLDNLLIFLLLAVVFVVVGFIVAISVVGTVLLAMAAAVAALVVFGLGLAWPIVLTVVVVWLLVRASRGAPESSQQ